MVGGWKFFEVWETINTEDVWRSKDDGEMGNFPFAMLAWIFAGRAENVLHMQNGTIKQLGSYSFFFGFSRSAIIDLKMNW